MSFGYSVGDFLFLADKAYSIFTAIHDSKDNAPRQLQLLADRFARFGQRLRELDRTLKQYETPTYDGFKAFKHTLDDCDDFIRKYAALNNPNAPVWQRWLKSGLYTKETDKVKQLQAQADGHVHDIICFQNNLTMWVGSHSREKRSERLNTLVLPSWNSSNATRTLDVRWSRHHPRPLDWARR